MRAKEVRIDANIDAKRSAADTLSFAPRGALVRDPKEPGGEEVSAGRVRKQHVAAAASAAARGEGGHVEGASRFSALLASGDTAASATKRRMAKQHAPHDSRAAGEALQRLARHRRHAARATARMKPAR